MMKLILKEKISFPCCGSNWRPFDQELIVGRIQQSFFFSLSNMAVCVLQMPNVSLVVVLTTLQYSPT